MTDQTREAPRKSRITKAFVFVFVFLFDDWKKFIAKFAIGVALAYIGFSAPQYVADYIKMGRFQSISDSFRTQARTSVKSGSWSEPDYRTFEWLRQVYADQSNNSSQQLDFESHKLPFQILGFRWTPEEAYGDGYLVRWSSICNSDGCRYDVLNYKDNVISFSFFARNVRWSEVWINKKPVFVDVLGRVIFYDGQRWRIDDEGSIKAPS